MSLSQQFAVDFRTLPYVDPTDQIGINWLNWRSEIILARNRKLIAGKRVLDLACRDSHFSYPCLVLGAKSVTGVEGRQESLDLAKNFMAGSTFASKMTFVQSDVFDFLKSISPGDFEVILCLGFLYHTVRQAEFFLECECLKPESVFVCTSVAKNYIWFGRSMFGKPPALFVQEGREDSADPKNTTEAHGIVYWPSVAFIENMFERIDYDCRRIDFGKYGIRDWRGLEVYKNGKRAAFVATRRQ